MKRVLSGLAAATLAISGCSTADDQSNQAPSSTATVSEESSAQAAPSTTSTANSFIPKKVNEDASAGCSSEDRADCDVVFRVAELVRGFECSVPSTLLSGGPIPDTHETILVRFEAEMADSFTFETSDNILHSQHHGVIDGDGYYIQSPDSMYCPDVQSDLQRLYPGTKARGANVLAVPKGTQSFRLGMLSGTGGWEWEIPA